MYFDEEINQLLKDNYNSKEPINNKELGFDIANRIDDMMGGISGNGWFDDDLLPNIIINALNKYESHKGKDIYCDLVLSAIDYELDIADFCSDEWEWINEDDI